MFDNICKYLVEQFSTDFAQWLLGEPIALSELSPSELSMEPIRADAVILMQAAGTVLHLEFQTQPDEAMPFRMADYCLRIYRRFPEHQLRQVVIYLSETQSERVYQQEFVTGGLRHHYEVIRLWEQPSEVFFQYRGLLPFAVLGQSEDRVETLRRVNRELEGMENQQVQRDVAASTAVLAGLVLEKGMIQRVLRSELMKESVIYQEWRAEALAEGQALGRAEGRAEGQAEGRAEGQALGQQTEAVNLVLRLLRRRLGELPPELMERVSGLPVEALEDLGEALLDFSTRAELEGWLEADSAAGS